MKNLTSKSLLCLMILLSFLCDAWSQDNAQEIKLKSGKFREGFYSKNNGFWLTSYTIGASAAKDWNYYIQKFSPDLSKKEWEVEVESPAYTSALIYDKKNPTYLYLHATNIPIFGKSKENFIQISPNGKLNIKEDVANENFDYHLFAFCNATHYYELYTKKKSQDLMIVKYDHQSLERSDITVKMPTEKRSNTFEDWSFSGVTDSTAALIKYEEKEEAQQMEILIINLADGRTRNFIYKPNLGNISIAPSANDRFPDGVAPTLLTNWQQDYVYLNLGNNLSKDIFFYRAFGNIVPAPDGTGFYFYALANFSKKKAAIFKRPDIEGYILTKLDNEGREVWSKKEIIKEEVDKTFYKNSKVPGAMMAKLRFIEEDNTVSLELNYNESNVITVFSNLNRATIGWKYDTNGNLVDKCMRNFSKKILSLKAQKAENTEDIMPCFSEEKTKRIVEYIDKEKTNGIYSVFSSQGSYALIKISEDDNKSIKCLYF